MKHAFGGGIPLAVVVLLVDAPPVVVSLVTALVVCVSVSVVVVVVESDLGGPVDTSLVVEGPVELGGCATTNTAPIRRTTILAERKTILEDKWFEVPS